jgi:mannose-6-phosphate isomerase-like protein (cupin superfamily)
MESLPRGVFDLARRVVGMGRDGRARLLPETSGPPLRIEGLTIGVPQLTHDAPHAGEMHPDGDELLYLISGRMSAVLEEDGGERVVELRPGEALIVPRGVWHRLYLREPSQLLHVTPGPRGEHRPLLPRAGARPSQAS